MHNLDLLPILLSLIFLSIVVLWVAIKNHRNFLLMIVLIPITIFSGWTIYTTVDNLLGYPVIDEVQADSFYLYHVEDPMGDYIYVYLIKPGELKPKSIMVIGSDENKEALENAKEATEEGKPQLLRASEGEAAGNVGQTNGGELEVYDFQMSGNQVLKDEQRERERQQEPNRVPGRADEPELTEQGRPLNLTADDVYDEDTPERFRVMDPVFYGGK